MATIIKVTPKIRIDFIPRLHLESLRKNSGAGNLREPSQPAMKNVSAGQIILAKQRAASTGRDWV
jgi:hypothetical protein